MNNLDIQVTLSSRFKTSSEADKITIEMWQLLGLETKAQFARLAIGRSLALGKLSDEEIDSKGIEVPAQALFSTDNIGAWIGLLVAHSITSGSEVVNSQESLRSSIRGHWHRGALELWKDWKSSDDNYDKFVELLVTRRSEMPEELEYSENVKEIAVNPLPPIDDSNLLVKALDQLQIKVQVKETINGPRVTRYKVFLVNLNDLAKLNKNMGQLALALNLGTNHPSISNGDQPMTVFIDVPRPKNTWSTVGFDRLEDWVRTSETNTNKLNL